MGVKCIPCRQSVNMSNPIHGRPLRELIQHPWVCEPNLTYDGCKPQWIGAVDWMCHSVMEEKCQNDQSHYYYGSIWCEFAFGNGNNGREWLWSISNSAKATGIIMELLIYYESCKRSESAKSTQSMRKKFKWTMKWCYHVSMIITS